MPVWRLLALQWSYTGHSKHAALNLTDFYSDACVWAAGMLEEWSAWCRWQSCTVAASNQMGRRRHESFWCGDCAQTDNSGGDESSSKRPKFVWCTCIRPFLLDIQLFSLASLFGHFIILLKLLCFIFSLVNVVQTIHNYKQCSFNLTVNPLENSSPTVSLTLPFVPSHKGLF
jgi:hypothetical protein